MAATRLLQGLALSGALMVPGLAMAGADTFAGPESFSLSPDAASEHAAAPHEPTYLQADAPEKPNVHGFISVPFKTAYVTPRGLVVEDSGLVIQPVGGFVFPLGDLGAVKNFTFVTGVWNSINTAQDDTNVGAWNEMDYFASFSGTMGKFSGTLTYGAWLFPQSTEAKPSVEHNIDFKIVFDDSEYLGDFSVNPYVDFFWAVSGSSTVVLGDEGGTGYVELGIVPKYVCKSIESYPITFSFPTYISVGPEGYWGRDDASNPDTEPDGCLGVFSTAINASVPLSFIPTRYGYWHGDLGVTYLYLGLNDTLLRAGTILTDNTQECMFVGSIGFGVDF